MSKYVINGTTLTDIGDAVREKGGTNELIPVNGLAAAIINLPSGGGGGDIEVEPIVLTGGQGYGCAGPLSSKYIELFGDTISTNNIDAASNMFNGFMLEKIPFSLNFRPGSSRDINYLFSSCHNLKQLPAINNYMAGNMTYLFMGCWRLREIPENYFDSWDWHFHQTTTSGYSAGHSSLFYSCYSLRKIPLGFLKNVNPRAHYSYSYFYSGFTSCWSLDELTNLPIPYIAPGWTSNAFNSTLQECHRLKEFTFETNEDGTPKVVEWKNQTITFSTNIGALSTTTTKYRILDYNSGITADKEVKDDATYQALKNDPDWFSCNKAYSRYNHDSAVNTINSLPDTSAYLATAGGTNTLRYTNPEFGSATDGGAINTLTEAEIAVATAKGWTVTFG